jgi:hypothetical protein
MELNRAIKVDIELSEDGSVVLELLLKSVVDLAQELLDVVGF